VLYFWTPKSWAYRKEHVFIRKTVVFFMVLYAPYQTAIVWLSHALVVGAIVYPNLEKWLRKDKAAEEKSEIVVESSGVMSHPIPIK
jgi:hypothetical protein